MNREGDADQQATTEKTASGKDPFRNNWPIYGELWRRLDGGRLHRRIDQYACFAFLASLVLAAPKSATYS